jgi:LSD1 subclass zinc finger protein
MTRLFRCTLPVLCAGLLFPLAAAAQTAPAAEQPPTPPPGGPRVPYVPKNLKVLPDNTDLRKVMRGYEGALGVECAFCHTVNPATKRPDPPSDANPVKEVARSMIRMTDDLNEKYLSQLPKAPNLDADAKIECGTCHRGHSKPEAFIPPPRPEGNRPPGAAAPPAGAPPAAMAPH